MKSISIDKFPDNGARIEITTRYIKKCISDLKSFLLFSLFRKNTPERKYITEVIIARIHSSPDSKFQLKRQTTLNDVNKMKICVKCDDAVLIFIQIFFHYFTLLHLYDDCSPSLISWKYQAICVHFA